MAEKNVLSVQQVLKKTEFVGSNVTVRGWARTRRDSKGGFSFIELNDGSCFANLQIIADKSLANYEKEVLHVHSGTSLSATGRLVASEGKGQGVELQAESIQVLGACDPLKYPIGKQRVSFEVLRDYAHLRTRTNTFGAVTRIRNHLSFGIHRFFQERGFFYLNSPVITPSDAEGAGKMFQVSTLDMENPPRDSQGKVDYQEDFFGRRVNLTVSGQLEAEAYACSLGKVYTFGPTFRAENSNTSRHLAEFWMVEPEMAFADLDDDADLAESFLKELFSSVLSKCGEDMEFFEKRVDKEVVKTLEAISTSPFARITYTEAVKILEASGKTFEHAVSWGSDLQSEHERYLTEEKFRRPVVVTDYPKGIKAFYMKVNEDGKTVRAMDVLVPRIGEIIGGSQREDRIDVLQARMDEIGIPKEELDWYLDLRRFGSVPHAGFGLGFERLVQFVTGMTNIRDVIPFPRTPGNARF